MAFPPQFSSTEKYANRYDLDEISVFLEGTFNNPMFFNVSKLPNELSFGKHYFNLVHLLLLQMFLVDLVILRQNKPLYHFVVVHQ